MTSTVDQKEAKTEDDWISKISRFGLFAVSMLGLGWGCYLAYLGKDGAAVTFLGVGAVFLLLTSFHRFKEVEVFGMKAKMRKLKKTIKRAEVTVEQLRALAEVACEGIVPETIDGVRDRFITRTNRVIQYRKILRSLGSDEARAEQILKPLIYVIYSDAAGFLMRPMVAMNDHLTTQNSIAQDAALARGEDIAGFRAEWQRLDHQRSRLEMVRMDYPIEERQVRLQKILEEEQFPSESFTAIQRARIAPWLPRLAALVNTCEIKDPEIWHQLGRDGQKQLRVEGDAVVSF